MNIDRIYSDFYEDTRRTRSTRVEQAQYELMEFIRGKVNHDAYLAIEAKLASLLNVKEEEAFKDGFCVGIHHITQAVSYAGARLAR